MFYRTAALLAAVAVIGSNSLSLGPIAPEIARNLAVPVEQILQASAAFGLGTAFGAVFLARWIDRFGAVSALRATFLVLALAFVVCAAAPNVMTLVVAQSVAGIAAGVGLPAVYSRAVHIAPPGFESRSLGIVLVGWTLSLVLGVALATVLADVYHWRVVYLALVCLSIIVLVCTILMSDKSDLSVDAAPSPLLALGIPGVRFLLLLIALYMLSFYMSYAFVGDHVVQSIARPVADVSWVAIAYGSGFGLAVFFDAALDRLEARRAIPLSLLLLAMVYLVLSLPLSFRWLVTVSVLWGIFNHLALNILMARLSAVDPQRRGTVLGLYSGITYLCMGVATLVAGFVYPVTGWQKINLLAVLLCTAAAALSRVVLPGVSMRESNRKR